MNLKALKRINRLFGAAIILLIASALVSCTDIAEPTATAEQTPAITTPVATAAPTASPEPSVSAETSTETPSAGFVYSAEYSARENIKVTMHRNLGDSMSSKISYVYIRREGLDDEAYLVTQYDEKQPIFYTDFFADEDGLWSHFSDSPSNNVSFLLPESLEVGMEFVSAGDESVVLELGADFEYGGYSAKDCLIISSASVAYSQNVFHVYEKGVGEIARYMKYDADVIDMIFVAEAVEEMSEADVKAFIDGL